MRCICMLLIGMIGGGLTGYGYRLGINPSGELLGSVPSSVWWLVIGLMLVSGAGIELGYELRKMEE